MLQKFIYYINDVISTDRAVSLTIQDGTIISLDYSYINNYLDEENKPINNLYTYFKESCRHNLACIKAQNDPHLFDDWFDE